ncbi:hypothetical protein RhiirA4_502684 [Rhizophagus irregularis]|uniref:Uncharacterized protein n=1 Tax=Rhizophagus irregularis TaxID=588596 RepID=A0A2I1G5J3_9GLOM|nr:hypothetical protein RhiirA4_502684 [Rhizophagus irregularis]
MESELFELESDLDKKKGTQAGLQIARRGFQLYAGIEFDSVERERKRMKANEKNKEASSFIPNLRDRTQREPRMPENKEQMGPIVLRRKKKVNYAESSDSDKYVEGFKKRNYMRKSKEFFNKLVLKDSINKKLEVIFQSDYSEIFSKIVEETVTEKDNETTEEARFLFFIRHTLLDFVAMFKYLTPKVLDMDMKERSYIVECLSLILCAFRNAFPEVKYEWIEKDVESIKEVNKIFMGNINHRKTDIEVSGPPYKSTKRHMVGDTKKFGKAGYEDQEFSLPQELAYNEERLEKTLALINTIYHITDIRHSLFPIEYPDSSNDGIAYVFHVENWADKKAVFGDIQYSLGKPSGAHSNTFCLYLGVKCKDEKKNMSRVKALQEYLAAIKTKCCYNNYTCNGKLVVRYHKANRSDANQYFIGCSLYTFSTRHRYISGKPNIDEDLLKELFRNEERISTIEDNKKCFTIILSASRKKECHLKSCPYIVMVVKNTHSHPPPPSHRIPGHLQENVKNLIKNSNDLLSDTTPRKLISGPLIKAVFGEVVLSDIYASMNNIDKLHNIVMKE